ncbi:hypothetical protein C8R44DRAFT_740658 [Mycena epipterygia]|nr:hypothetical protein C8R44DRAFT_740658 [Mycena epipterygia]
MDIRYFPDEMQIHPNQALFLRAPAIVAKPLPKEAIIKSICPRLRMIIGEQLHVRYRDAKLDISQIKRLLTEHCATFFNEDIVVYVPEKARTGQAAKEYFWKDGEVESRIKEQIREACTSDREADTSDTRHHYQGVTTKVSAVRMFTYLHLYIHTRQIG